MNTDMQLVLGKIDTLISMKGFVYALIVSQIEDETILASNLDKRNNHERLSSNEILFLWSLLVNKEDFWQYPDTIEDLYDMRCEIHRLLEELQRTFFSGLISHLNETLGAKPEDYKPYYDGNAFQEAIFYSGGALYDEEYLYYIKTRYTDDAEWLKVNKGFDKDSFCKIVCRIKEIIAAKIRRFRLLSLPETLEQRLANKPCDLTEEEYKRVLALGQFLYDQDDDPTLKEFCDRLREAVSFTKEDLSGCSDVDNYLKIFCLEPSSGCNGECKEPGDYSILMSKPIIWTPEGSYLLTEIHQLFKCLYDEPRYWLLGEFGEHGKKGAQVGDFSERQTQKVLKGVFGENCYSDILVYKGKQQLTDIDALCIWKDYALCFQIKSKGLKLSSHQGNIASIEEDFKLSIQAAYGQGKTCREALLTKSGYSFKNKETKQKIELPSVQEVYIICETSDEYPSLAHQMALLLQREESDPAALAVNLFDIDLMGKYLNKPYYFVHYVHNRLKQADRIRTDVEINCLSAYTYNRLYLDGSEYDRFMFDNSFAKGIDAELMPQYAKQKEVKVDYSLWRDATFDALINEIESSNQAGVSQIIIKLLNFSRDEVKQIGQRINELLRKGQAGKQEYYSFRRGKFGFTFIVMDIGGKEEIHNLMKAVSIKEMKSHNAQNWLTVIHFCGSNSLVGTLAYISGKRA